MVRGSLLLVGVEGLVVDRVVIDAPGGGWCTARPTRSWLGGAQVAGSSHLAEGPGPTARATCGSDAMDRSCCGTVGSGLPPEQIVFIEG